MANRSAYSADAETVYGFGVFALRPINDKVSIFANLNYQNFGDEITDSPIVDEDEAISFFAGFLYEFF